jgi:hypothetical protein
MSEIRWFLMLTLDFCQKSKTKLYTVFACQWKAICAGWKTSSLHSSILMRDDLHINWGSMSTCIKTEKTNANTLNYIKSEYETKTISINK